MFLIPLCEEEEGGGGGGEEEEEGTVLRGEWTKHNR